MKRILIIAAFFGITMAMVISSCKKDVTLVPLSGVSLETYFKSNKDLQAALAGMYSAFQEEMVGSGTGSDVGYGGRYHYWGESRSDNFAPSQYASSIINEIANNGITINNGVTDWGGLYKTIFRANTILKFAPQVGQFDNLATPTVINNGMAQAYAMRAESYFYIVRLWGDAPIWTEPYLDITVPGERARSAKAKILDSVIIPDLQKAYTLISPKQATPSVWYINEGAICSMLADVYMWKKDYANAKIWIENLFKARAPSGKIYSSTGAPVIGDIETAANWKTNNFLNPAASIETIWSIHWDQAANGCACLPISTQLSNNPVRVDSTFYFNWKKIKADIRLTTTLDTTAAPTNGLGKWDKVLKFYNVPNAAALPAQSATLYNVYLPMYRLSDMILLYAEALNKLSDRTNAIKYLNLIRTRANVPVYAATDPAIATADLLEDVILQERQYETFAEGKRWFDLIRTNHVNKVMDPILKLRQARALSPVVGFPDLNKVLFPISRSALNANKSLVQNPSY